MLQVVELSVRRPIERRHESERRQEEQPADRVARLAPGHDHADDHERQSERNLHDSLQGVGRCVQLVAQSLQRDQRGERQERYRTREVYRGGRCQPEAALSLFSSRA